MWFQIGFVLLLFGTDHGSSLTERERIMLSMSGCQLPAYPDNGRYVAESFPDRGPGDLVPQRTILTFSCSEDYEPSPQKTFCSTNKRWTSNPVCHKKCEMMTSQSVEFRCFTPFNMQTPCQAKLASGSTVRSSCKQGLLPRGSMAVLTCEGGVWSGPSPKCTSNAPEDQCDMVTSQSVEFECFTPFNMQTPCQAKLASGSTVRSSCKQGLVPQGSLAMLTCDDGVWSGPIPECTLGATEAMCKMAVSDSLDFECWSSTNITMVCGNQLPPGTRLVARCKRGYSPLGQLNDMNCLGGAWDKQPSQCERSTVETTTAYSREELFWRNSGCVLPQYPSNGSFTVPKFKDKGPGNLVPDKTILAYYCIENYEPTRTQTVCMKRSWSSIPVCQKTCCMMTSVTVDFTCTSIYNANVKCNDKLPTGTVVRTACKPGYTTQTSTSPLTCREGKWIQAGGRELERTPTCKPDCGLGYFTSSGSNWDLRSNQEKVFPWHVDIFLDSDGSMKSVCGGTLIQADLVVSDANCFYDSRGRRFHARDVRVVVGRPQRVWPQAGIGDHTSGVRQIFTNSQYEAGSGPKHDVALLRLQKNLKFTDSLHPACFDVPEDSFSNTKPTAQRTGKVLSWRSDVGHTDILEVSVQSNSDCQLEKNKYNSSFTRDKFCAGHYGRNALCGRDLGNGLLFTHDQRWYLSGVASILRSSPEGDSCTGVLYTDFSMVKTWIKERMINLSYNADGCTLPAFPKNGQYKIVDSPAASSPGDVAEHGAALYYTCDKGFVISNTTSKCQTSNTWSASPFCTPSSKCDLEYLGNVVVECMPPWDPTFPCETALPYGTEVRVKCKESPRNVTQAVCGENGWDPPLRQCQNVEATPTMQFIGSRAAVGCLLPEFPAYGNYTVGNSQTRAIPNSPVDLFTVLTYRCDESHDLDTKPYSICVAPLLWNPTPSCYKRCALSKLLTLNMTCYNTQYDHVTCDFEQGMAHGYIVRYECLPFHTTDEYIEDNTCSDGKWDHVFPTCKPDCGYEKSIAMTHIIRGEIAKKDTFPWHVGVYQRDENNEYEQICGGSILRSNVVISAAHCFYDTQKKKTVPPNEFRVAAGKLYRSYDHPEEKDFTYIQKTEVKKIFMPNDYEGKDSHHQADIVLLELVTPFKFYDSVHAVCLDLTQKGDSNYVEGAQSGKVAGWGKTETREASKILKTLSLPTIDKTSCRKELNKYNFGEFLTMDKMCAGHLDGFSVCQGDSGGGLVFANDDSGNRWFIRGIVSAGAINKETQFCANTYTTFTRVFFHTFWINQNLKNINTN